MNLEFVLPCLGLKGTLAQIKVYFLCLQEKNYRNQMLPAKYDSGMERNCIMCFYRGGVESRGSRRWYTGLIMYEIVSRYFICHCKIQHCLAQFLCRTCNSLHFALVIQKWKNFCLELTCSLCIGQFSQTVTILYWHTELYMRINASHCRGPSLYSHGWVVRSHTYTHHSSFWCGSVDAVSICFN